MADQNLVPNRGGLWETAPGVYLLLNGPGQPATDEHLVTALIAFSNGKRVELARTIEGRLKLQELGAPRDALRTEFSSLLALAAENLAELADAFVADVGLPLIHSLKVRPTIDFGGRGFSLGYFRDFPTLRSALQYAVLLLLDLKQPYGAALCRCRLERCRAFYLARRNPKGGPANRQYCTPEHRTEAHNLKQNRDRAAPRRPK